MRRIFVLFISVFIIFAGCTTDDGTAPVSGNVGKLCGNVYDEDGNPIKGVKVSTNPEFIDVETDENGYFEMAKIPGGTYTVNASKSGYSKGTVESKIAPGYKTTVKIVLTKQTDENHPPEKPHSPNPENQSVIIVMEYTLKWKCSDPDGDPLKYDVYFGTNPNDFTKIATDIEETEFQISNLEKGRTFSWKVIAKDGQGAETSGDIWTFSVKKEEDQNHPPEKPHSPVPENGATVQYTGLVLKWECSDPDGDPLYYDVYFGTSNPPENKLYSEIRYASAQVGGLEPGIKYYWRIIARDGKGGVSTGDVWHFMRKKEEENRPPLQPHDPNPADNAVIDNLQQKFTWKCADPDGDELKYDVFLRMGNNSQFAQVASNIKTAEISFSNLSYGKEYQWRVIAKDTKGASTTGSTWNFSTKEPNQDWKYKLIAYYPLNGDGNDASGNQRHAHNNGAVPSKDRFNNENSSMFFEGLGVFMIIPHPQAFALQGDFTIAYWIKPYLQMCKPWDTHIDVVGKSDLDKKWWVSGITQNLGTEFWVNGSFIGYDNIKLKDMNWNHIAVVFHRTQNSYYGTAEIYLNGTKLGSSKNLPAPTNLTSNVWIGEREDHKTSFAGWLDDMYFYDRALSQQEIMQLSR